MKSSHSYPSSGTPLLTAAGLVRGKDMPGRGETGTQKLSDGSWEDCGPEAFWAWEKRKTNKRKQVRRLIRALGNHTCPFPVKVLSSVKNSYKYFLIPSSNSTASCWRAVSLFIFCILGMFICNRSLHTINSPAVCEGIGLPQGWVNPPSL